MMNINIGFVLQRARRWLQWGIHGVSISDSSWSTFTRFINTIKRCYEARSWIGGTRWRINRTGCSISIWKAETSFDRTFSSSYSISPVTCCSFYRDSWGRYRIISFKLKSQVRTNKPPCKTTTRLERLRPKSRSQPRSSWPSTNPNGRSITSSRWTQASTSPGSVSGSFSNS